MFTVLLFLCTTGQGQAPPPQTPNLASRPEPVAEEPESEAPSFTLKAITQLVTVEVEARDAEDNPVRGLTADELQVTERIGNSKEVRQKISFFQPATDFSPAKENEGEGIYLTAVIPATVCEGNAGRYELAYYLSADSRKDGFHQIFVKSRNSNLKLYFRRGYKIEAGKPAAIEASDIPDPKLQKQLRDAERTKSEQAKNPGAALATVACYDTLDQAPLLLKVQAVKVKPNESASYEFVVEPTSLGLIPEGDHAYRVQLQFAICTFNTLGQPLRYFENTVDETLTESQYQSVMTTGFSHTVEFPAVEGYSARLVVRNLASGALGTAELQVIPIPKDSTTIIGDISTTKSFGTTSPAGSALCGDVYNLPPWTTFLPRRFSAMRTIGAIYANSLAVHSWPFTEGVPGVTSRTEWFAINYLGQFWIDEPDDYEFTLSSDDGAKLYIDEKLIIYNDAIHGTQDVHGKIRLSSGQHRIRVAYFQGPRTQVTLVLALRTPEHKWKLFDTRDFPHPPDSPAHGPKLPLPNL